MAATIPGCGHTEESDLRRQLAYGCMCCQDSGPDVSVESLGSTTSVRALSSGWRRLPRTALATFAHGGAGVVGRGRWRRRMPIPKRRTIVDDEGGHDGSPHGEAAARRALAAPRAEQGDVYTEDLALCSPEVESRGIASS